VAWWIRRVGKANARAELRESPHDFDIDLDRVSAIQIVRYQGDTCGGTKIFGTNGRSVAFGSPSALGRLCPISGLGPAPELTPAA
jgi:hypothetical protein